MTGNTWTHPQHKYTSFVAALSALIALGFAGIGMVVQDFYFSENGNGNARLLLSKIGCDSDRCFSEDHKTDKGAWQVIGHGLMLIGLVLNAFGVVVQVFIFWPLVFKSKVVNLFMRLSQYVHFLAAYCKFIGVFTFIVKSGKINENYSWEWQLNEHVVQIESGPIGMVMFSFVIEIIAVLFLKVSRDIGARNGITHLERLQKQHEEEEFHHAEEVAMNERRKSSYAPSSFQAHSEHLLNIEKSTTTVNTAATNANM